MGDWSIIETWLARAVLELADLGGMPDSYWQTDSRVEFARDILGIGPDGRGTHDSTDEEV